MYFRVMDGKEFEQSLNSLQECYQSLYDRYEELYQRYSEYDKDEEISEYKETIKDLQNRALYVMTDKQMSAQQEFRKRHSKKCKTQSTYLYGIYGSAIGSGLTITCPKCGETEDLTDFDTW